MSGDGATVCPRCRRLLVVLFVFALVGAACADDSDEAGDPTGHTTPPSADDDAAETDDPAGPTGDIEGAADDAEATDPGEAEASGGPYEGYVSDVYDDPAVWICWPGADDVCSGVNDLTLVFADGSLEVVPWEKAPDARIDCILRLPEKTAAGSCRWVIRRARVCCGG